MLHETYSRDTPTPVIPQEVTTRESDRADHKEFWFVAKHRVVF